MSLAIHRTTQQVLLRLPSDLTPMIRGWIGGTRSDWRTCKRREALLIENYNEGMRRFVQELMARRERRLERSISWKHPIKYQFYRIWMYWYGVYQIMVATWHSHTRGN